MKNKNEQLEKLQSEKMLKKTMLVKLRRNINLMQTNNAKGNKNRVEFQNKSREIEEIKKEIEALDTQIEALKK